MSAAEDARQWESATWRGARRAKIREYLKLTVRERLEAVAAMCEVAERLKNRGQTPPSAPQPERSSRS